MREVRASAPGKVNLILHVGAPTADGYHPLTTVFESLNMREYVTVRTSRTPGIHVSTQVFDSDGRVDPQATRLMETLDAEQHLAVRAAKSLQRLAAATPWAHHASGVNIHVEKHVPIAGGMAGGSADAAATLVACNELWELGLSDEQLHALGRSLGADVPACLMGGIALGTGRGDHMVSLTASGTIREDSSPVHHWVMVLADRGLSTPEVFRALDAQGGPGGAWGELPHVDAELIAKLTGESAGLAGVLINELSEPAYRLRPELADTCQAAHRAGALGVVLSGSGPTVAALAQDENHAAHIAQSLAQLDAVADVVMTSGPAAGARIDDIKEA